MGVFYEFMRGKGYERSDIVWFDVQASPRGLWSSEMVRRRKLLKLMQPERNTRDAQDGYTGR